MSVGSETVNGVNHIRAHDIMFLGTDNGFRIKTGRDRGNEIADMVIERLQMTDVTTPISQRVLSDHPGSNSGRHHAAADPRHPAPRA
jgi:polygalacturonase